MCVCVFVHVCDVGFVDRSGAQGACALRWHKLLASLDCTPNRAHVVLCCVIYCGCAAGRSQFLWPEPGQPRIPMDESLFLVPAADTAGPAVDNFCLGVITVHEVGLASKLARLVCFFLSVSTRRKHNTLAACACACV